MLNKKATIDWKRIGLAISGEMGNIDMNDLELAKKIGCGANKIYNWRTAKEHPSLDDIALLSEIFYIPIQELIVFRYVDRYENAITEPPVTIDEEIKQWIENDYAETLDDSFVLLYLLPLISRKTIQELYTLYLTWSLYKPKSHIYTLIKHYIDRTDFTDEKEYILTLLYYQYKRPNCNDMFVEEFYEEYDLEKDEYAARKGRAYMEFLDDPEMIEMGKRYSKLYEKFCDDLQLKNSFVCEK